MYKQNVLTLQKEYIEIIRDIEKIRPSLPEKVITEYKGGIFTLGSGSYVEILDDELVAVDVKAENCFKDTRSVVAYDESIAKYKCLEGTGYHTAHSVVTLGQDDYIPKGLLTFYFYTSSKSISEKADFLKYTEDENLASKKDYLNDRIEFLVESVPPNSLLLIDGPLIGGDAYVLMINAIEKFHEKNIIPIFFVKNSNSNLIVDTMPNIRKHYNSDMHWSYSILKQGQRISLVKYTDAKNELNSKVFTYFKAFNKSPQRIEMHNSTYVKYQDVVDKIMSTIYYYLLAQGSNNPQVRPIAVAEMYAREFIKVSNIDEYFFGMGFVPTMNQERFGY